MRSRGINLTVSECEYLDEMAKLTFRSSSEVLRTAIHNLWELTQSIGADGDLKAVDVLAVFMDIDRNFKEGYTLLNGGRSHLQ